MTNEFPDSICRGKLPPYSFNHPNRRVMAATFTSLPGIGGTIQLFKNSGWCHTLSETPIHGM